LEELTMAEQRTLIVYHSGEGQTAKISERVAARLRDDGHEVEVSAVEHAPAPDVFDVIVAGDSIRLQHHSRQLRRYLSDNAASLEQKPMALFQVSMTSATADEEHTAQARKLVDALIEDTGLAPDVVALFAGALAYTQYGWFTKRVMRWISRREGGDTDTSRDYEYTDWEAVDAFADRVCRLADRVQRIQA
jgi:menaquinone-dependent protoporphyrinogen oxidase